MPFSTSARITVTNEGKVRTNSLYYAIDYVTLPTLPADVARFHAQYRQAAPCRGWTNDWTNNGSPGINDRKNLDGQDNYVFMEAKGKGHFVGVTQAVLQNQTGWFGEGDDMIFVDNPAMPIINGTGTEDYFLGSWDFGGRTHAEQFSHRQYGAPLMQSAEKIGGRYCLYRFHGDNPVTFNSYLKHTIEHGHANDRADNFYSCAFWYQNQPYTDFPAMPPVAQRRPRVNG
jgi:hypothetical protein